MGARAAWNEGYLTALRDFGVQVSGKDLETRVSENPHDTPAGRRRLSDYERRELRSALGYHFEDCLGDWEMQAEIVETTVERILSRRPERDA